MKRRNFIRNILILMTSVKLFSNDSFPTKVNKESNFKYIYNNKRLKRVFLNFLKNVFNLYPENKFHKLILKTTQENENDKKIYLQVQAKLMEISPLFSTFKYSLPALLKQKNEMAQQTVELLIEETNYNGYLEIGSSGRYLDKLEEKVKIKGKRYYADGSKPGFSATEMIDRGQVFIGADYIPFTDYNTQYTNYIPLNSLDLVCIYIGFHHCPKNLRLQFIGSIRDSMRVGAKMILRDHDCDSEDQKKLVSLAHDVFNLGTNESWEYNNNELRNFYSLSYIIEFIEKIGFKFEQRSLFQAGDPTKNALMLFTKINKKESI